MSEILNYFNQDYQKLGQATRAEIHEKGLWHETFHCWIYTYVEGELSLYFQQRACQKKDFPNQLDISAAGHLLATEGVSDGLREVEEELGLKLAYKSLESLGVFPMSYDFQELKDREFTNIFLYDGSNLSFADFHLQMEEVQGLYLFPLNTLMALLTEEITSCELMGISQEGSQHINEVKTFRKKDICAQSMAYYQFLFEKLKKKQFNCNSD